MTERLATFDSELRDITDRRGQVYGHPAPQFDRARRLKAVIAECHHAGAREALEMIAVKISRLIETPGHVDSWLDIAGYARCGVMVTEPPDGGEHKESDR